ncbi:hypothetical protein MBANPS3_000180 [Mucor bainieri]
MVNQCQALPHEVWNIILNQVEDKSQLATCRLVCKQWNPIAEKAMFSSNLTLRDQPSFVAKLHYHLTRKPALAPFIKSITVSSNEFKPNLLFSELLKLVMNPNLENISGIFPTKEIETLFYQIILDSPHKLKQLKRIPLDSTNYLYPTASYALRESLECMCLTTSTSSSVELLNRLNEFTRLEYLQLVRPQVKNMEELDSILDRLQCAIKLDLATDDSMEDSPVFESRGEMDAAGNWCNLVEYLVHKYPKLDFLSLERMFIDGDIARILQATKHIPHLILTDSECDLDYEDLETLWTMGSLMRSPSNIVKIEYDTSLKLHRCIYRIEEARREDKTKTSEFSVKLQSEVPHAFIKQLLSGVGSGTSVVTKASLSLFHEWNVNDDIDHTLLNLYDILKLVPAVQDLTFSDATIEFQERYNHGLMLNDLKTLEIAGAKIDYRVLSQLGSIAPSLDHLTLSSSIVIDRPEKFAVIMPHSNLSSLTFKTNDYDENYWNESSCSGPGRDELASIERDMEIDEILYLRVQTESFPVKYYVLREDIRLITMISGQEFNLHATAATIAHIECKSLSSLSFSLENLWVDMHFKNGVLESQCPIVESDYLKMEKKLQDLENQQ